MRATLSRVLPACVIACACRLVACSHEGAPVYARDYDQACMRDDDCVAVQEGRPCTDDPTPSCTPPDTCPGVIARSSWELYRRNAARACEGNAGVLGCGSAPSTCVGSLGGAGDFGTDGYDVAGCWPHCSAGHCSACLGDRCTCFPSDPGCIDRNLDAGKNLFGDAHAPPDANDASPDALDGD